VSSAEEDSRSPLWAPVWEFLQLWLEEAKAERPTRPETLYHYTDVAGLMGILGT